MDLMFGVHQRLMVTSSLCCVQMEYLQKNEYFPFKTVIIDDSLQNTLGKCLVSFGNFWFHYLLVKLLFLASWSYLFFL